MTKQMMSVITIMGVLTALGFICAGCENSASTSDNSRQTLKSQLNLGMADNGSAWSVQKGCQVIVNLQPVSGTGYEWRVTSDQSVMASASMLSTDELFVATATFTFVAKAPGTTMIGVYYQRPWESAPVVSFSAKMTVE